MTCDGSCDQNELGNLHRWMRVHYPNAHVEGTHIIYAAIKVMDAQRRLLLDYMLGRVEPAYQTVTTTNLIIPSMHKE